MVTAALNALLRLVRTGLRHGTLGVQAGHGYADPNYRPVRLPWVSVIGPLDVLVEPERDPPAPSDILVQLPGTLTSAPTSANLAGGSTLVVRADEVGTATVSLAAADLGAGDGAALAADLQAKLAAATWKDDAGADITDPDALAPLQAILVRWSEAEQRLVLISGRTGYIDQIAPSRIAVTGGSAQAGLGLGDDAVELPGRLLREKAPVPKAFAVDVRLDLWASSQHELGQLVERLLRVLPTRGHLVLRPALLANDVGVDATSIRLLAVGEPTLPISMLHLEAPDGLSDRVRGTAVDSTAGVTVEVDHLAISGTGTLSRTLWEAPLVPDPRRPVQFNPTGHAVAIGVTFDGPSNNDQGRLASLVHDGRDALVLDAEVVKEGPDTFLELTAEAELERGGSWSRATTVRRLPIATAEAGILVHVSVEARTGRVSIWVDGAAQDLADTKSTPVAPTTAPGRPAGGDDMVFTVGDDTGTDHSLRVDHVHLLAEPVPAVDPRLRTVGHGAAAFAPGDRFELATTPDGRLPEKGGDTTHVLAVDDDTIVLDRPLTRDYARGASIAFARTAFIQQRQLKRRDDLRNRLYRLSATYRVSTLLEEHATSVAGSLVLDPQVDLVPQQPPRPSNRGPATRGEDGPPARPGNV